MNRDDGLEEDGLRPLPEFTRAEVVPKLRAAVAAWVEAIEDHLAERDLLGGYGAFKLEVEIAHCKARDMFMLWHGERGFAISGASKLEVRAVRRTATLLLRPDADEGVVLDHGDYFEKWGGLVLATKKVLAELKRALAEFEAGAPEGPPGLAGKSALAAVAATIAAVPAHPDDRLGKLLYEARAAGKTWGQAITEAFLAGCRRPGSRQAATKVMDAWCDRRGKPRVRTKSKKPSGGTD